MITSVVIPISVVLLLIFINGVFVAAEFALVGSRKSRLDVLAQEGNRAAKWIIDLFDRPTGKDGYIAIAQLGITLASIGLGMYGEPAVARWLYGPLEDFGLSYGAAHTFGFIIALTGITYMHVVFGEMIPKALALQTPENVIIKVNPIMRAFGLLFRPMVAFLNYVAIKLMHAIRIPEPDKTMSLYTSDELAIVTDESAESGQLEDLQRDLIHNIFEMDERRAEELMTSRHNLEFVDVDADEETVTSLILSSDRSRYPVIDGSLDNVIGVLHIKDFIRAQQKQIDLNISSLMRPLPSVVGSTTAEQLLQMFKTDRTHASLVVDEYGSTLGIVTLDDIIADVMESDIDDDNIEPVHHADGSISLDGEVTLAELAENHDIAFEHEDAATIAGIILAEFESFPNVGDAVQFEGYELTAEEIIAHKITRVRIAPLS